MALKFEGCVWFLSVFVRFLWTMTPQTGYIHPDEFFQGPEITTGDVLSIQTTRAWEFNETFPLRNIVFPYVLTAVPLWITKGIMSGSFVMSAGYLLVLPRLALCVFSLIIDLSIYLICRSLHVDPASRLCVVGTSFVTLVFYCRPLSNSVESVLFASLLALVVYSLCYENLVPSVWSRLRAFVTGLIVAAGIWNRPTFLVFSVAPLTGWLYNVFSRRRACTLWQQFATSLAKDLLIMALGCLTSCSMFTAADSFYFGYLQKGKLVLTPLNFLFYNLDSSFLKEHGLHPRYVHFAVNMPLLFGPLALILAFVIIKLTTKGDLLKCSEVFTPDSSNSANFSDDEKKAKHPISPDTLHTIYTVLLCSVVVPVCLLSAFPHQEPRFIIPVLVPLAVLFSPLLLKSSFGRLSWICWNIFGCVLFGVLHQGGVCSSLAYLQKHLASQVQSPLEQTSFHVMFYRTYMPPQHLMAWPPCGKGSKCKVQHNLTVHDLGGSPESVLIGKLDDIITSEKLKQSKSATRFEVYIVCPSTVKFEHDDFSVVKQFFPHLTMEDAPDFPALLNQQLHTGHCGSTTTEQRYQDPSQKLHQCSSSGHKPSWMSHLLKWFKLEMSLNLYQYRTR